MKGASLLCFMLAKSKDQQVAKSSGRWHRIGAQKGESTHGTDISLSKKGSSERVASIAAVPFQWNLYFGLEATYQMIYA